jgi:hypothetical protein
MMLHCSALSKACACVAAKDARGNMCQSSGDVPGIHCLILSVCHVQEQADAHHMTFRSQHDLHGEAGV